MKQIFNELNFGECITLLNDRTIFIKDGENDQTPCEVSDINKFDFKINNPNSKSIFFLKIDYCVYFEIHGKKCDFSVNDEEHIYFVEIKYLKDFSNSRKSLQKQKNKKDSALEQLIQTLQKIKVEYTNINLLKVFAVICLKPDMPQYTTIIQTANQIQINRLLSQTGCPNLLIGNEITFN